MSPKQKRALSISILAAVIIYVSSILVFDHQAILSAIGKLGWKGWLIILCCSLVNYSLRFFRWQYYLQLQGHQIPYLPHILYYIAGFALTTTPGKAGETIRSVYLKPYGVNYTESLACFFTERFLDLLVISFSSLLIILVFDGYTGLIVITITAITLFLPLVKVPYLTNTIKYFSEHISINVVSKAFYHLAFLLSIARHLFRSKPLLVGMTLGNIAWLIQGVAFYFVLTSLGVDIAPYAAIAIYAVSLLAGALSFIPGGIGSTEAVMGILLYSIGADTSVAVAAPLISRLSTLWFAVLLGLMATSLLSLFQPSQPQTAQH